jgi:general secretion pathway protein K
LVLTALMVMVLSFSVMTRAETYGLLAFKESMEKKFLAEAGIERAIMEIIYRSVNNNQSVILAGMESWKLDGTNYRMDMGDGGYSVRIVDEAGKISLNGMTDNSGIVLKNLLLNQGVTPEKADIIVDSILDWKDEDDLHRLSGAENDYYLSLPNPYKARNANFETLDELILVKGITPEILYGRDKMRGIIHFLSMRSDTTQININTAPREVLAAIPGINGAIAAGIMEFRAVNDIRGVDDIKNIIGDSYPQSAPYLVFTSSGKSTAYSVEATGYKGNRKAGFTVLATITFDGPHQYHYVYYKSPAEIIP